MKLTHNGILTFFRYILFEKPKFIIVALLLTGFTACANSTTNKVDSIPEVPQPPDTITLIFAGDVMQHLTQINGVKTADGSYDYTATHEHVKNEILSADMGLANLEVPLAGKPYSGYPLFSAPDEIALALKDIGFSVLVTANNHSCDKGMKGVERTITMLDSFNIHHTGMFRNQEERDSRYPLNIEVKGIKMSVLDYSYGTNGLPVYKPYIINLIDTVQIIKDIEKAKQSNPDIIIACMHWGVEYQMLPNKEQKQLTEMLFNHGVNLIIGAHPHVIQPMEKRCDSTGRCDKLVAYSLGNFVSNQPFENSDGGALLKLKLVKDSIGAHITWAGYSLLWVHKPKIDGRTRHYILPAADYYENNTLSAEFQKQLNLFVNNARKIFNKHNVDINEYRIEH